MNEKKIIALLETITHQNAEIIALLTRRERQRERYQARREAEKAAAHVTAVSYTRQILEDRQRIQRSALYEAVKALCRMNGEPVPHKHTFYQEIVAAGFREIKSNGVYYISK